MLWQILLTKVGLPILQFIGIALAIISVIFGVRQWGKKAEQAEQLQTALKNSFDRARVDAAARAGQLPDNLLLAPSARR